MHLKHTKAQSIKNKDKLVFEYLSKLFWGSFLTGGLIVNWTGLFRSVPWRRQVRPYGFRMSELD